MKNTPVLLLAFLLVLPLAALAQEGSAVASPEAAAPDAPATATEAPAEGVAAGEGVVAGDGVKIYAGHAQEKLLAKLVPMVDAAMEGYNKEDHKVYFADFCKAMEAVATEQTFRTMVQGMWKKENGAFKAKKLLDDRCSFNDQVPLLMFEAEFENGKRLLAVNFTREGDLFRVMQISVNPLP